MFARIKASLKLAIAAMASAFKGLPIPELAQATQPVPTGGYVTTTKGRCRKADSNAAYRRRNGIPHGTSGSKLARRAAQGRIGLRGNSVALYAVI